MLILTVVFLTLRGQNPSWQRRWRDYEAARQREIDAGSWLSSCFSHSIPDHRTMLSIRAKWVFPAPVSVSENALQTSPDVLHDSKS